MSDRTGTELRAVMAQARERQLAAPPQFREPSEERADQPAAPTRATPRSSRRPRRSQRLWTVAAVARLLVLDEPIVAQLATAKLIPSLSIAGELRFRPESIEGWLSRIETRELDPEMQTAVQHHDEKGAR